MAIIATNTQKADVQALGTAMNATVNFSGALMEMLATVYVYILMAAIREAIQNASDASKRAGIPVSQGVLVQLPTQSNPMITIIDQGSGMTKEFMESTYMSFGSSTKAGDNGAAGGLGVGRWAAYGYIRECYITTCHGSDMVERTYFQFQGPNGTPQVQLASEVPGTVVGTRVYFPVKETDLEEALRAVAWLKEVMQLTMGDSFSVDKPALLPTMLPTFSGTLLELESQDPSLKGVRLYPMQGNELQYGRQGLQSGSLVVLTNQESGVGGLPFHVQSQAITDSVFSNGVVVEIPMSFNIPFMPSREEIKYTDEVRALMGRIDEAARKVFLNLAKTLFDTPTLESKATLSKLVGTTEHWHLFARAARGQSSSALNEPLKTALGGSPWTGVVSIPAVTQARSRTVTLRGTGLSDTVVRTLHAGYGRYLVLTDNKGNSMDFRFNAHVPLVLVLNDLKSGGLQRFRLWILDEKTRAIGEEAKKCKYLFVSADTVKEAEEVITAINAEFGGILEVQRASKMPEPPRRITKAGLKGSKGGTLAFYNRSAFKQETEVMGFDTYDASEPKRIWLGKNGGELQGFKADVTMADLVGTRYSRNSLHPVMDALSARRLYLLTPKQVEALEKAQADLKADGLWDLDESEYDEEEDPETVEMIKALKGWTSFEAALGNLVGSHAIQDTLAGNRICHVVECWQFNYFCNALAKRPRMELTGTRIDKALQPHVDLLTGEIRIHKSTKINESFNELRQALVGLGGYLAVKDDDSEARKQLVKSLEALKHVGNLNYDKVFADLKEQFPLLHMVQSNIMSSSDVAVDHLCQAMAALYR